MSESGVGYNSPTTSRFGQSAGGGWNTNDRKRIPTENLVYPERIISGRSSNVFHPESADVS
jgi:hypothetical protein